MIELPFAGITFDFNLHSYWYLGRAGGFIAYSLLVLSMILGLAISSRIFDGLLARAWFFEMHKVLSLLLIAAILFHVFIMLPDPYAQFSVDELLVPFRSHSQPIPLAVGIISFYALVLVSASFYLTKWIGQKTWRALHYLTFSCYLGGAVHGIWAGSDTNLIEVRYFYLATGLSLFFLLAYRILAVRGQGKAAKRSVVSEVERPASVAA